MVEVSDLSERLPHLTVTASDGVHVIPVSLIRDVIAGRQPAAILSESLLQRIIEEWLAVKGSP